MSETISKLNNQCFEMKIKALELALKAGSVGSHIGGAFSCVEILSVIYHIANIPDMYSPNRDRVILSKGHAVLAYYTVLWKNGYISEEELNTFDSNGTMFHGHPRRDLLHGIEFSAGSLGLGISYAVGVALSCKKRNINNRIYVLLGDGECDEGIVWEALISIRNFNLDNITIIIDKNNYQLDGPTVEVMNLFSLKNKFESFGFNVNEVDGHDIQQLMSILSRNSGFNVCIANTIKANGISFLMNNKQSHHTILTPKKYNVAINDIMSAYGKI